MTEQPPPIPAKVIIGANFWVRLIAHGIDLTILTTALCGIFFPYAIYLGLQGQTEIDLPMWAHVVCNVVPAVGIVLLWRFWQTTPGKRMFQLKVVDSKTGERASWGKLIVRCLAYLVASLPLIPFKLFALWKPELEANPMLAPYFQTWWVGIPLGFGFFWILIDSRNRGWHDLLSGTVTVLADFKAKDHQP